jgi:hypothetical protein
MIQNLLGLRDGESELNRPLVEVARRTDGIVGVGDVVGDAVVAGPLERVQQQLLDSGIADAAGEAAFCVVCAGELDGCR